MPELKQIERTITHQGCIDVNKAFIEKQGENICAVMVDLQTKRPIIEGDGESDNIPCIVLGVGEDTCNCNEDYDDEEPTEISFPTLIGWDLYCATIYKYTLRICFIRKES